jgi:hypothetical protein
LADKNHDLLVEIRKRRDYCVRAWQPIYDEGDIDMRYVSGDPWDPDEKRQRKALGRPCLALDELNQYTNQLINSVKQNPRAAKVTPEGDGANDETARYRGGIIRRIEYKSDAQAAYQTGFENMVNRSFGFVKVRTKFISDKSFDVEPEIVRVPNPKSIYLDPDAKKADSSDMGYGFEFNSLPTDRFKELHPEAKITDFSAELMEVAPNWIREERVVEAAYWKVKKEHRQLLMIDGGGGPLVVYLHELPKGTKLSSDKKTITIPGFPPQAVQRHRKVDVPKVCKYITNGVEILSEDEFPAKRIPIIPFWGKELYVPNGTDSEKKLMSLVRLARDPYMLYCYLRTNQSEFAGMVPKVPAVGYEGQFEGHEDEWNNANKVPIGFLQAKLTLEDLPGHPLPLPTRTQFDASPIIAMDQAAESARRAIQAAMGISALPTAAQRQNQKSGIALERIENQQALGSFNFIESYDKSLQSVGELLNEMITTTIDTERDMAIFKEDQTPAMIRANGTFEDPESGEQVEFHTDKGEHSVTISTGPSSQSQREEVDKFADVLAGIPEAFARCADLIIRMKNLGPLGDALADRLTPPEYKDQKDGPGKPEMMAAIQQLQAELDAAQGFAKEQFELANSKAA